MFTVSNLEKSLDISEMVARNDLRIHVEFVRAQRMGELVQRIQQSSVKILQLQQHA
jgi:hydroxypyruvate isomerase